MHACLTYICSFVLLYILIKLIKAIMLLLCKKEEEKEVSFFEHAHWLDLLCCVTEKSLRTVLETAIRVM